MRFVVVGGLATLFDYAVFFLLRNVVLPDNNIGLGISTFAGFTIGFLINYILSIVFVYKQTTNVVKINSIKTFVIFMILALIGLLITEVGMFAANKIIDMFTVTDTLRKLYELVAKVVMTVIVLIYNYISRKLIIFK